MSPKSQANKVAQKFSQEFGREAQWIVAAPGRVNVIGEHTDYNDGFVLPMAIDRRTVIAAAPAKSASPRIVIADGKVKGRVTVPLKGLVKKADPAWANYVRGVIAGFQRLKAKIPSFDMMIETTVPLGGGLSSSAALEVAMATMLEVATGKVLDPVEKALLCQKAEHEYAGMPCGIMDQFISVMGKEGHLLLLDCRSRETELVPMTDEQLSLLIVNTNVKHELTGGGYAKRREQCYEAAKALGVPSLRTATIKMLKAAKTKLDPVVFKRARHVIGEIDRTVKAAKEIKAANWPKVGELMYASHYSLKDDYEVSCEELDVVVELAEALGPKRGVIGCRMTGGGFGGCAVALVETAKVKAISEKIAKDYQKRTGIKPALFVSRPSAGATVVKQ